MLVTFKTIGFAPENHNILAIGEYIYCNITA